MYEYAFVLHLLGAEQKETGFFFEKELCNTLLA